MNFIQALLGMFLPGIVQRMEGHSAKAQDHIALGLAAIEAANAVALTHDQKTQQTVSVLTQAISDATGTNAAVQQKAQQLTAVANAIKSVVTPQ